MATRERGKVRLYPEQTGAHMLLPGAQSCSLHQPVPVTAQKPNFAHASASTGKEESVIGEREAYRARPGLKKKDLTSM